MLEQGACSGGRRARLVGDGGFLARDRLAHAGALAEGAGHPLFDELPHPRARLLPAPGQELARGLEQGSVLEDGGPDFGDAPGFARARDDRVGWNPAKSSLARGGSRSRSA